MIGGIGIRKAHLAVFDGWLSTGFDSRSRSTDFRRMLNHYTQRFFFQFFIQITNAIAMTNNGRKLQRIQIDHFTE